ncbi:para-aminobenzoate N-oxygenase AurF [Amycolatopsis sulphurea]|uniref:Para-aminobenzoate N-oxygenase AurF n=1 Tax=Amycolatopsis sulphurea TaxID=76022 RepID=A0A2A9FEF3_9PSEU|nr:diiron oxygenase [Amycolatopsis sulphurea]PFG49156.1 para-aminobenzoate N-oxygenase AurF [Amycolatopsis sulphurea]
MTNKLEQGDYRSGFANWEDRASVRSKPRRILDEQLDGKLFFPPELVGPLNHPAALAVADEDTTRRVLLHRLHLYLDFTEDLEQLVVNPVTQLISRSRLGFELPRRMLRDAYMICTDESWHALFSDDLQQQIVVATGERPVGPRPQFLSELDRLEAGEDSQTRGLTRVFFTLVSETLISAILSDIPRDDRIITSVREMVADHAEDERRHHAYFAQFFQHAWFQLGSRQRAAIGPMLPVFVTAFLGQDPAADAHLLRIAGVPAGDVRGVVEDLGGPAAAAVRHAAAATLRLFERNGVMADTRTYDSFAAHGLVS